MFLNKITTKKISQNGTSFWALLDSPSQVGFIEGDSIIFRHKLRVILIFILFLSLKMTLKFIIIFHNWALLWGSYSPLK
jgi:hypothetical protein